MKRPRAMSSGPRDLKAVRRAAWICTTAAALAGCAAGPPLHLYTLAEGSASSEAATAAADPTPARNVLVIQIDRVTLPDYLDSRDLIVRRGDVLERSNTGRWASRLSAAATELLTAQVSMRLPHAWVTDQPERTPDYRLVVHIARLDITSTGTGVVEADWEIVPRGASGEIIRRRTRFTMNGAVGTDEAVVHFERLLLDRLASEIDLNGI